MPKRKRGAKDQYRTRRMTVTFEVQENTASPYDDDDVVEWFGQTMPEVKVLDVQFPLGTYWDETPDPTVEPDKS